MMTRKPEERRRRVHLGCEWQGEMGLREGVRGQGGAPTGTPGTRGPRHSSWISPEKKETRAQVPAAQHRLQGSRVGACHS